MTADPMATTQNVSPSIVPGPAGGGGGQGSDPDTDPIPTSKWVLGALLIMVVVGLALIIAFFGDLRHWTALHTGMLHGGPDLYYNFWSGFGSDLGEATLISAVGIGVYTGVRKVNCHTKGCWRIGHHLLEGTPYILCRHHHPGVPTKGASHQHILEQHRKYKEAQKRPDNVTR
ncbi:MAG TPA: hypothetical protein VHZ02_02420 [Acidimicrobiales bacterium]|jgi:hypothetical protein|nr:hypothetical protein [Acidimicrobiales bacterium]